MLPDLFKRFILADTKFGRKWGTMLLDFLIGSTPPGMYTQIIDGNITLEAADRGVTFIANAAATVTLPVAAAGLGPFHIVQTADANLAFAAPASNDSLIHKGDAAADSVTFSTAGQKIGSAATAVAVETATDTWKWLILNTGGTTATVA